MVKRIIVIVLGNTGDFFVATDRLILKFIHNCKEAKHAKTNKQTNNPVSAFLLFGLQLAPNIWGTNS